MTAMPVPRLPNPLTPERLQILMRSQPYQDTSHPHFKIYRRIVQRGFEIMYPDTHRDEFGRGADAPLPPERIAHLVAKENAALDNEFGERRGTSGEVHVQFHARDGGKVEVADYWRAAPGQSGADENVSDPGANTLEGQAGDDTLPPLDAPKDTPANVPTNAHVAPDPEKLVREWTGTWQGQGTEKFECVGLVKEAIPGIGHTPTWREGDKIIGPGDPPLEPGTAIATFTDGKYTSKSGESHAAIFLGYGTKDGRDGIRVLDQFRGGQGAEERFIPFNRPDKTPVNRAESFSVIKKRN